METFYDILFAGQIVEGFEEAAVREKLAVLFKANAATLEKLFSGQPQLIKRAVDKTTAAKYRNAMHQAGAVALVKASSTEQAAPAAEPKPAPPPAAEEKPMTMAERLAAVTGEAPPDEATTEAPTTPDSPADESGLSLAPVGADVLQDSERPSVEQIEVDTGAMQVDESGADLPSLPRFENIPPPPDTSDLSLGNVGEEIPNLASELEVLDIDTSAIDLDPEGTDFSDCAPPPIQAPVPDVSGVELAPEGSEMLEEQYRKKDVAAMPKVDHIQLSDDSP